MCHTREQRQLAAYSQQQRLHAHGAEHTAEHVAAMLAQVSPRQRRLLLWYAQGYGDAQVAAWLTTTSQAVRVTRHGAYCALRAQLGLPDGELPPLSPGRGIIFWAWPNILPHSMPL